MYHNYLYIFLYTFQSASTPPDTKHKQNPRIVVTIFITNIHSATMHHGDPHRLLRGFYIIEPLLSHSPTQHNSTNTVSCERVVPFVLESASLNLPIKKQRQYFTSNFTICFGETEVITKSYYFIKYKIAMQQLFQQCRHDPKKIDYNLILLIKGGSFVW